MSLFTTVLNNNTGNEIAGRLESVYKTDETRETEGEVIDMKARTSEVVKMVYLAGKEGNEKAPEQKAVILELHCTRHG